jgi:putative phage-type endonuclease
MPYKEWLEWRRKGIGGSDASVVCGINRWKSPVELWMEKTGQLPESEAGEAAYWGNVLEDVVRAEFTKRTGIEVTRTYQLLQSEEHPFMLANLDGTCRHPEYGFECVFEAKTSSAYRNGEWEDSIPDEYQLQIQHYMAVTGFKGAYVAVLIGGNSFKWFFIERDDGLIDKLIHLERDFWQGVQENIPPPLDGSDASAKFIGEQFPNSVPSSRIDLPREAASLLRQYDAAGEKIEHYAELKQEAENLLKQLLGENEVGVANGRFITWKSVTQERLNGKRFKAEQPSLYKEYINTSSHRRFSISVAG